MQVIVTTLVAYGWSLSVATLVVAGTVLILGIVLLWLGLSRLQAKSLAPTKTVNQLERDVAGQVLDPVDYSAFIGRNPGNESIFVVTGDSGQGITHGVVASLTLKELILQGRNDWSELYDPSRKTASAVQNLISENIAPLKNFAEYIALGEISSLDELSPAMARSSARACRRSPPIATPRANCICARRSALTSAAMCTGTRSRPVGTVLATGRNLRPMAPR